MLKIKKYRLFAFTIILLQLQYFSFGQNADTVSGTAMNKYLKQKHQIEFKDFIIFYNKKPIILDSIRNVYKVFGKPSFEGYDLVYTNLPFYFNAKITYNSDSLKKVAQSYYLDKVLRDNKSSLPDVSKYLKRDSDEIPKGSLERVVIQLADYDKIFDVMMRNFYTYKKFVKPVDGYILVEGMLVNKETSYDSIISKMEAMSEEHFYEPANVSGGISLHFYSGKVANSPDKKISFLYHKKNIYEMELYAVEYSVILNK